MSIATLADDGLYDLTPAIEPYGDGLAFQRARIASFDGEGVRGTWVMGIVSDGSEQSLPLLQTPLLLAPGAALAALGYALADGE